MIEMEIGFNILYLLTIYLLVGLMIYRFLNDNFTKLKGASVFLVAFVLLAIGDTGHVGFRLLAFSRGGLEQNEVLVGLGALATAITITFFYMLMTEVWTRESGNKRSVLYILVMLLGVVRLVVMTFPENSWGQVVPPYKFSLIRNSFLCLMGVIVVVSFLSSGLRTGNRFLVRAGYTIICSFVFYIPVILFVQKVPMFGMLMIPKTIAYVILAVIGYRRLFIPRVAAK